MPNGKISKPRLYDLIVTRGLSLWDAELATGIRYETLELFCERWGIPIPKKDSQMKNISVKKKEPVLSCT